MRKLCQTIMLDHQDEIDQSLGQGKDRLHKPGLDLGIKIQISTRVSKINEERRGKICEGRR